MGGILRGLAWTAAGLAALLAVCALGLRPPVEPVPPRGITLHHVNLAEPGRPLRRDHSIRVEGRRIARVAPTPPGTPRDGFAGSFVTPGLVDLHVHHPPALAVGERRLFALLFLAHGVTTVRDTGSALPATLRHHARAIARGERPGPRVLSCGPFLDGDPPDWPGARVVRDDAEGRRAAHELADAGYDCAKLYNALGVEAVHGILQGAAERGLPVVGHVPWALGLDDLPGVEVQHLMGVSEDWEPLSPAEQARYVRTSRELGISHTPTLVTFARAAQLVRPAAVLAEPVARLLPRYHREVVWNVERNALAREQMTTGARLRQMERLTAALHAAGVPVLAGTDTMNPLVVPGASLHEELALLVEAGLSVGDAWAAATWRAGEALGVPGLGRLTEGAPADLLVLRADPTGDLAALETLTTVVADGRPYPIDVLRAATDRALAHFAGVPYEPLSITLARAGVWWLSRVPPPP